MPSEDIVNIRWAGTPKPCFFGFSLSVYNTCMQGAGDHVLRGEDIVNIRCGEEVVREHTQGACVSAGDGQGWLGVLLGVLPWVPTTEVGVWRQGWLHRGLLPWGAFLGLREPT